MSGAKGWEGTSAQSEHMDKLPCCLGKDQMWLQGLWVIASFTHRHVACEKAAL